MFALAHLLSPPHYVKRHLGFWFRIQSEGRSKSCVMPPPKGAMLIKAIWNRLNKFRCFVVETARFCESELELVLRARRGCEGRCSGCGVRGPCYEHRRKCWSRLVWSHLSGEGEDSCGERICPGYRKISRVSAISLRHA